MRIALGTTIIETSEHQPISVILTAQDKEIIANMPSDMHIFASFDDSWDDKAIRDMLDVLKGKI